MPVEPVINPVVLVPVTDLAPAVYNPRETDPQRLEYITTSLTKMGFILPLYATPDGHLLSGHQRLLSSTQSLGCTHVPVVYMSLEDEARRRGINIIFNRSTNDMRGGDTSERFLAEMSMLDQAKLVSEVPSKAPNTPEFYATIHSQSTRRIGDLLKGVEASYTATAVSMCAKLLNYGICMPIVVSESGKVVNGVYRLYAAADRFGHDAQYPVVVIKDTEARVAELYLNKVSMSFTVENQYADVLRYGSFRRKSNAVEDLTECARFFADGRVKKSAKQSLADPHKFWQRWRENYGNTFLDFGAGLRMNERLLRLKGVNALSWEPYPTPMVYDPVDLATIPDSRVPHLPLARMLTDRLLDALESGIRFDSILTNNVLNSIPFLKDRLVMLTVVHALCSFKTKYYGSCRGLSSKRVDYSSLPGTTFSTDTKTGEVVAKTKSTSAMFEVPYERNVVLGDVAVMPKVQKFHSVAELKEMLSLYWAQVRVYGTDSASALFYECSAPRRVNWDALEAALRVEFDLPYAGGESLGRADRAVQVFKQRLGVTS